jgi:hypothetical protein
MDSVHALIVRGAALLPRDATLSLSPTMINLLVALMALTFAGLLITCALYAIRKVRRSRAARRQGLPQYNGPSKNTAKQHRRLTVTATPYGRLSSNFVYNEKSSMMRESSSPPLSPDSVPEIRITFPDEQDESGRRKSGRVVVVRVGETSVGLEPLQDEQLPAYEKEAGRFHSIDIERIGGLKEKEWS